MTRYFFNLHECGDVTSDNEGLECGDISAIEEEAIRAARGIMSAEVAEGRLCLSCRIEVRDEAGALVLTVPFNDAVTIAGS